MFHWEAPNGCVFQGPRNRLAINAVRSRRPRMTFPHSYARYSPFCQWQKSQILAQLCLSHSLQGQRKTLLQSCNTLKYMSFNDFLPHPLWIFAVKNCIYPVLGSVHSLPPKPSPIAPKALWDWRKTYLARLTVKQQVQSMYTENVFTREQSNAEMLSMLDELRALVDRQSAGSSGVIATSVPASKGLWSPSCCRDRNTFPAAYARPRASSISQRATAFLWQWTCPHPPPS